MTSPTSLDTTPQLDDFDYVEFYVGNARQTAHFLRTAFGFKPIAYAGLETGVRDRASILLQQGAIRLIITEALDPESPIADHVKLHGDSIKDIAFTVADVHSAFESAVKRGARSILEPVTIESPQGSIIKATIGTYGDTTHSLIQRVDLADNAFPQFQPIENPAHVIDGGFSVVDHVAISLEPGRLAEWVDFYINVLGFHQSHEENIVTEYSGMNSRVVQNHAGTIKFPMQEPIQGKRRSQVEEFLTFHHGAGAQHLAILTDDIIHSIQTLRANGIEFVRTPATYYENLQERVGLIDEDIAMLRDLHILVDRDSSGYLLQIFTKPLQSRPTMFFEIIQRKNAVGFGSGNIKALFAAVEREQALRGNL